MITEEQLKERESGIGSSDSGAVLGVNPYRTPVDVYLEKTGQVESPDLSDNAAVYFGNVLEETVANEYARRTGTSVRRRTKTFRHSDYPWMIAHPDRTVDGYKTILECKTAGQYVSDKFGPDGTDQVPDEYLIQVTHQMIVMGYPKADLAVLIGGRDYRIYHIDYDPELADLVIEREREFWQDHVEQGLPPDPQSGRDLVSLYPSDSGNAELASADAEQAYSNLLNVRNQKKELEQRESELKQQLQSEMRDASALVNEQGQAIATWKKSADSLKFDHKAFYKDYPQLHQQYSKTLPGSRRFLIK